MLTLKSNDKISRYANSEFQITHSLKRFSNYEALIVITISATPSSLQKHSVDGVITTPYDSLGRASINFGSREELWIERNGVKIPSNGYFLVFSLKNNWG